MLTTVILTTCILLIQFCTVNMQGNIKQGECKMPYTGGSLVKPCSYCRVCTITNDNKTGTSKCVYLKWVEDRSDFKFPLLAHVHFYRYIGARCIFNDFCSLMRYSYCDCSEGRKDKRVKGSCIKLPGSCKCICDKNRYGQLCKNLIPAGLSTESFADIHNIIYSPYTYSSDYAVLTLYFYTVGINFEILVQTERELLTYDDTSCTSTFIDPFYHCDEVFGKGEIFKYEEYCRGRPTYLGVPSKISCAVTVNLAFPRVQVNPQNKKQFIFNFPQKETWTYKDIAGKLELVSINVSNSISNSSDKMIVFHTEKAVMTVYAGKTPELDKCIPILTISMYAVTMFDMPRLPRTKEIPITSSVVMNEDPQCTNLGDPEFNWFIWMIKINHNEKDDPPLFQAFKTPDFILKPFTLEFGVYKIKHEIRFVQRLFVKETTYCYFEIVPLPLNPVIIGGSLRYVYYKDDLELITTEFNDPNLPLSEQSKVLHVWYCNNTDDSLCDKVETNNLVLLFQGPFEQEAVYNFTMEIKTPITFEVANQVIIMSSVPIPSLLIECLRNCGGKNFKSDSKDIFYFKVSQQHALHRKQEHVYNWTYYVGNSDSNSNLDLIRQEEETPSWILIIKENTLHLNQEYTFKVIGGGNPPGEAQIIVKLFKIELLICDFSPKKGIAGETKFSINCKMEVNEPHSVSSSLIFYDKFEKDSQDGRLLASTFLHSVDNIILTRGTVTVLKNDINGQHQVTHLIVPLSLPVMDSKFLSENMKILESLASHKYNEKVRFVSALCDIFNENLLIKSSFVEIFLKTVIKEQLSNLEELELLLTSAKTIICDKVKCYMPSMTKTSYMYLQQILSTTGTFLERELIKTSRIHSEMTTEKVNLLYHTLVSCAGVLLSVQDERLMNKKVADVDYRFRELFKYGNLEVMKTLNRVNQALAIKNIPYIKHKCVQTEQIETWMKDDDPSFFTRGTKGNYNGSYVRMSTQLAKYLSKISNTIILNSMEFKQNPFWWSQCEGVSTEVVSLTLGFVSSDRKYHAIKTFADPIDIFLQKKSNAWGTVDGKVSQPNPNDSIDIRDLAVVVYKTIPPKGSMITLNFMDLGENDVLRVSVTKNQRPDYDQLLNGTLISKYYTWYNPLLWTSDDNDILFIGILPGNNVSVGRSVSYKFDLQSARCQVWYKSLWTITGCQPGTESTDEFLHCQCTHLSSVAGFLRVPVNFANPFTEYSLFLTLPENPYVFAFIATLFSLYVILLIWSVKNDRHDQMKTSLIVLEDNISSDRFGYLVIVFTGSRLFGGTTSNIGMIIHGSNASSRSHILRCTFRDTLKRNYDDWFLLFAPRHLGIVSSIQLWTDQSGLHPNWFCDKIYIHDLTTNRDYKFMLSKWFGVTQVGTRVESFSKPVKTENEQHVTELFLTNIIYGFRENHLWVSILSRHPRSPVSRSQRLSMAMVALMVTLLISIMFVDVLLPNIEEPHSYEMEITEILISVFSLIIASVITGVVHIAFRKSYVYHGHKKITKDNEEDEETEDDVSLKVDKGIIVTNEEESRRKMVKYAKKGLLFFMKTKFYPVRISRDIDEFFIVYKKRAVLAWVLCISIIVVTCYYIILLGLKIGKVKSLMWLTNSGMSLGSDFFVVDPCKIFTIALIFGIIETQVCNLYGYDARIDQMRKGPNIKIDLKHDLCVHKLRLKHAYRNFSEEKLKVIQTQIIKIKNWWTFIHIFDILFTLFAIYFVISLTVSGEFNCNSFFKKLLFKTVDSYQNYQSTMSVRNISSYYTFIPDISAIYETQWYNKQPLTAENELPEETGWIQEGGHRIMGVPRLRQIRTVKKYCNIPLCIRNLKVYCKVHYSIFTEDRGDYGAEWKKAHYESVVFTGHPWKYTHPSQSTSPIIVAESDEIFQGGGYIVELKRNRRETDDIVLNLLDSGWLDVRTRITFLEITTYNVNQNMFTSIIFFYEHLESTLILSGERISSVIIVMENVYDIIFFLYTILGIVKLLMILNTVGVASFCSNFWTLFDLGLVCIVISYFLGHRLYLIMSSFQYEELRKMGKDTTPQIHGLIFHLHLFRILLGLLLLFATVRSLRLLHYGTRIISQKQKYTLYFSWSKILWITLALISISFSLQRLVAYTLNTLYPVRITNLVAYKFSFLHLSKSTIPLGHKMLVLLPCFTSFVAMVFYVLVLVKSYNISAVIYKREKLKNKLIQD